MDQAFVDLLLKVISTVGFPIFVAVWLLWRSDKLMLDVKDSLDRLVALIEKNQGEKGNG